MPLEKEQPKIQPFEIGLQTLAKVSTKLRSGIRLNEKIDTVKSAGIGPNS